MKSIAELKANWKDESSFHSETKRIFEELTDRNTQLRAARNLVQSEGYGFGERAFYHLFNLVMKELPKKCTLVEIGVFKGQILALMNILSKQQKKSSTIIGISPMSSADGYHESDYFKDVSDLHEKLNLEKDYYIVHGYSNDQNIVDRTKELEIDLLYVDGGHTYEVAKFDIEHYSKQVKSGGYMLVDDSCCDLRLENMFPGHLSVTKALKDANIPDFEFIGNVVHIKIFRKR